MVYCPLLQEVRCRNLRYTPLIITANTAKVITVIMIANRIWWVPKVWNVVLEYDDLVEPINTFEIFWGAAGVFIWGKYSVSRFKSTLIDGSSEGRWEGDEEEREGLKVGVGEDVTLYVLSSVWVLFVLSSSLLYVILLLSFLLLSSFLSTMSSSSWLTREGEEVVERVGLLVLGIMLQDILRPCVG